MWVQLNCSSKQLTVPCRPTVPDPPLCPLPPFFSSGGGSCVLNGGGGALVLNGGGAFVLKKW